MKKIFFPIAILAMVLTSCEKSSNSDQTNQLPSNYEKTILSFTCEFSEDFMNFYDIKVEGKDFDGKDINMNVKNNESFKMETKAGKGETTLRGYAVPKNPLPEIDTTMTYTFKKSMEGSIRAKVVDKEAFMSVQSFGFSGGTSSSTVSGKNLIKLLTEHPDYFERKGFDKTFKFTITTGENSISVGAEEIEKQ